MALRGLIQLTPINFIETRPNCDRIDVRPQFGIDKGQHVVNATEQDMAKGRRRSTVPAKERTMSRLSPYRPSTFDPFPGAVQVFLRPLRQQACGAGPAV